MANLDKLSLEALEEAKQRVDAQIGKLREEKREISHRMDAKIHRASAEARWQEMSQEERVAFAAVARES